MMKKRGLSAVVITLIMILLALVVSGIIWVVVSNLAKSGSEQIETNAKCLNSQVEVVSADCSDPSSCNVVVKRTSGSDEIGGIKVVLYDASGQSVVGDDGAGDLNALATRVVAGIDASALSGNVTEARAAIYFTNDAGEESVCSEGVPFDNIQLS
jgi:ABC-type Na+ efflux pump permease subunit